jgi:hypothetical protein
MFSVGTVLGKSLEVFFKNIILFLLLALIFSLPNLAYTWIEIQNMDAYEDFWRISGISILMGLVLDQIVNATIIHGVVQDLRGRRVTFGESLQRGIVLLLPVLGVALLAGLLTVTGFVLLVIPGLIVLTILWVAVPAAVVERLGVIESLGRSAALTRGHRWSIFGIVVIIAALNGVSSRIIEKAFEDSRSVETYLIVEYAAQALFTAFGSVLAAVGYYYLRLTKEGVDIEKIAEAFD